MEAACLFPVRHHVSLRLKCPGPTWGPFPFQRWRMASRPSNWLKAKGLGTSAASVFGGWSSSSSMSKRATPTCQLLAIHLRRSFSSKPAVYPTGRWCRDSLVSAGRSWYPGWPLVRVQRSMTSMGGCQSTRLNPTRGSFKKNTPAKVRAQTDGADRDSKTGLFFLTLQFFLKEKKPRTKNMSETCFGMIDSHGWYMLNSSHFTVSWCFHSLLVVSWLGVRLGWVGMGVKIKINNPLKKEECAERCPRVWFPTLACKAKQNIASLIGFRFWAVVLNPQSMYHPVQP